MAKKDTKEKYYPFEADTLKFEMLEKLIDSSFIEMKEFSKKKPDEFLNKFKVTSLNRILGPIKELLKTEPTVSFLDLLDEDTIPSYSDSILIIAQFQSAMAQFKSTYYGYDNHNHKHRWFTKENPISIFSF
jgi:hypothetical protein